MSRSKRSGPELEGGTLENAARGIEALAGIATSAKSI
jgi:hypothetical protein